MEKRYAALLRYFEPGNERDKGKCMSASHGGTLCLGLWGLGECYRAREKTASQTLTLTYALKRRTDWQIIGLEEQWKRECRVLEQLNMRAGKALLPEVREKRLLGNGVFLL